MVKGIIRLHEGEEVTDAVEIDNCGMFFGVGIDKLENGTNLQCYVVGGKGVSAQSVIYAMSMGMVSVLNQLYGNEPELKELMARRIYEGFREEVKISMGIDLQKRELPVGGSTEGIARILEMIAKEET